MFPSNMRIISWVNSFLQQANNNTVSILATVSYVYFKKDGKLQHNKDTYEFFNYNSKINALKLQEFQRRTHISPQK
jgi:hypothetical protein